MTDTTAAALNLLGQIPQEITRTTLSSWDDAINGLTESVPAGDHVALLVASAEAWAGLNDFETARKRGLSALRTLRSSAPDLESELKLVTYLAEWAEHVTDWLGAADHWREVINLLRQQETRENLELSNALYHLAWALEQYGGPRSEIDHARAEATQCFSVAQLALREGPGEAETTRGGTGSTAFYMPPDEEADKYVIRYVLFAGRRTIDAEDPSAFSPSAFTSTRSRQLQHGYCRVTLPSRRIAGTLPRSVFQELAQEEFHVKVQNGCLMRTDEFASVLRSRLQGKEAREALVYIHGFKSRASEAVCRAAQLAEDLDINGVCISYLWPSRGELLAYGADQNEVTGQAIDDIASLLKIIRENAGDAARIHVIGHSLGCRFLSQALQRLSLQRAGAGPLVDQVVFAAPDVDVIDFLSRVPEGAHVARGVTTYGAGNDWALEASRLINGSLPRAGLALDQIADAGLRTIDASQLPGELWGLGHDNHASAVDDMRALFWFDLGPETRTPLFDPRRAGKGTVYLARSGRDNDWLALSDAMGSLRAFKDDALEHLRAGTTLGASAVRERAERALRVAERLQANEAPFEI